MEDLADEGKKAGRNFGVVCDQGTAAGKRVREKQPNGEKGRTEKGNKRKSSFQPVGHTRRDDQDQSFLPGGGKRLPMT